MKDSSDKQTRDLLSDEKYQIRNQRGQAAYKARMREAGYKQVTVWVKEDSREAGRLAGLNSAKPMPEAAQDDPLGWSLGFAEGFKQREKQSFNE
ncbi:hypothetical protein YN16_23145 [Salmonella enterica subsp. enterica serovar Virchow]|nr:hypothetical protein [Salmonella enterica subsp. enterica serovar Virchow]